MSIAWPTKVAVTTGSLPRKNATRGEIADILTLSDAASAVGTASSSPYLARAYQGVDMRPRAFCIVEPNPDAQVLDRKKPFLRSSAKAVATARQQWRGVEISGRVEASYLYATSLSVEPYRFGEMRLAVLPALPAEDGTLDVVNAQQVLERGDSGMASWLTSAEEEFRRVLEASERTPSGSVIDYINTQRKLELHPVSSPRVVWGKGGANVRAAVVPEGLRECLGLPVEGFVVDLNQYFVACATAEEAHYLCGVLNTSRVNEAIKAVQTVGQQGHRDIHRRPLEQVPVPLFDASDERHLRIASLSQAAHQRAAEVEGSSQRSRNAYLAEIGAPVTEIEELVGAILDGAG